MSATYQDVLRIALALPGVTEGRAYGTPSVRVGRKFIARLREDAETLVVKMDPSERAELIDRFPDAFFVTDHYVVHPYVLVHLPAVRQKELRSVVEGAWRMAATRRQVAAHDQAARGK